MEILALLKDDLGLFFFIMHGAGESSFVYAVNPNASSLVVGSKKAPAAESVDQATHRCAGSRRKAELVDLPCIT